MVKPKPNLRQISRSFGQFQPYCGPSPVLQAHSCPRSLQNALAHHPQIGQREQHQKLAGVLGQALVTHLAVAKLALENSELVLDLGADTRLDGLHLIEQHIQGAVLVELLALARHHGDVPTGIGVLILYFATLVNTSVARVGKDLCFLAVQQRRCLRDVVGVGGRGGDGVHQARIGIHANVRLHTEVPLVALLGLVHLRVALPILVLGGTGCGNQGGIDHGAALEQQTTGGQLGIDGGKDLSCQLVPLQEVSKAQDGAFVGQAGDARVQVGELSVQGNVVQGFFHRRVGVPEELLQQVNAQHRLQRKGRAPRLACRRVRCNQRQKIKPWDDGIHLIEECTLARPLGGKFKSACGKAHLLHGCSTSEGLRWWTFADLS